MAKPTKSDRATWGRVASTSRTDDAAIRSVPPKKGEVTWRSARA